MFEFDYKLQRALHREVNVSELVVHGFIKLFHQQEWYDFDEKASNPVSIVDLNYRFSKA